MLKIASKVVNITPLEPTYIGGHSMRTEKMKGVHDEIESVVMWLQVEETRFLMINADLSNFDYNFVHLFKYAAVEKFNIPYDNIVLSGNHTHSGPVITTRSANQPHDPKYRQLVMDNIMKGAEEIQNSLIEVARVRYTTGESYGFYGNRNSKEKYGDQNIYVFEFKDKEDKNIAALVNISCHSTVLSPEEYTISGDLLAAVRRELIEQLQVVPLVCNGNAGDMSNRLYRHNNDFNELKRVSSGIAEQIKNFTTSFDVKVEKPRVRSFMFNCEYDTDKELLSKRLLESEKKLEAAVEYDERKWLISEVAGFKRKLKVDHVKLSYETTIIRMGDVEIVVMPCELVSAFGRQIKKSSQAKACFVWGYANGQTGYVVEASEFGGGHDGISTQLPKGKAEEYVGMTIQHLFDNEI